MNILLVNRLMNRRRREREIKYTVFFVFASFLSYQGGSFSHPCRSGFSYLSISVDILVVKIYIRLHGTSTVDLCLFSLFVLRSDSLFEAKSCIGYICPSILGYIPILCSPCHNAREQCT